MSLVISVTINDKSVSAAVDKLREMGSTSRITAATHEIGLLLERNIAGFTPVKTGAAKASVQLKRYDDKGAEVSSSLNYTPILEEGSTSHMIVPRNAKVLAFPAGGGTAFARKVMHPGTKPHHMFKRGTDKTVASVGPILKKHLLP